MIAEGEDVLNKDAFVCRGVIVGALVEAGRGVGLVTDSLGTVGLAAGDFLGLAGLKGDFVGDLVLGGPGFLRGSDVAAMAAGEGEATGRFGLAGGTADCTSATVSVTTGGGALSSSTSTSGSGSGSGSSEKGGYYVINMYMVYYMMHHQCNLAKIKI